MNQEKTDIKTPEYVSLQFQLAGLGSRAVAFIMDTLLLTIINIVVIITLLFSSNGDPSMWFLAGMGSSLPVAVTIIVLFILNWGYFFASEFFSGGRTLGKKMVGIRVIQENGHSITLLSSFIRNFLRLIDSLPASYFLGMIMIFFHSKHKRIGDLVAGTIVIHERKAKQKKKQSAIEKEIERRGLGKDDLVIDEWALKAVGSKEWKIIKTYSERLLSLPYEERRMVTTQIKDLLFPKLGIELDVKNEYEMENILLVLYLVLKDEWEFELNQ